MKQTVLIVDDSAFFRDALAAELGRDGALEVVTARNGMEALDLLLRDTDISAVVLDISTPILDGAELLHRLGRRDARTLFIVATGKASESERLEACCRLGANTSVLKPVDIESLSRTVRDGVRLPGTSTER